MVEYLLTKAQFQAIRWEEVAGCNKKIEEMEQHKVKHKEHKRKWSAKEAESKSKTKLMETKGESDTDSFRKESVIVMFLNPALQENLEYLDVEFLLTYYLCSVEIRGSDVWFGKNQFIYIT